MIVDIIKEKAVESIPRLSLLYEYELMFYPTLPSRLICNSF